MPITELTPKASRIEPVETTALKLAHATRRCRRARLSTAQQAQRDGLNVQVENDKDELVSDRTRNNYRDSVCQLFEFAKRRGYVSRDLETEASRTIRLEADPGKNHIITPAECAKGLKSWG